MEFQGRVALVTGASLGLGRRFALDLAAAGANVVGIARGAEALTSLQVELQALRPESWTRTVDVSDEQAVRALIDEIQARHGRLDILINNAAIERRASVFEMDVEHVRAHMRVNLEGVVHATLAVVPHMLALGEGWIVNVSSGVSRAPIAMEAAYAASKAALVAFSESISYELAPKGVRVKVLYPSFVAETRMAQESLAQGMPVPPRAVHRTAEAVSRALVRGLDAPRFEINTSRLEAFAPVMRSLLPRIYRWNIAKMHRA